MKAKDIKEILKEFSIEYGYYDAIVFNKIKEFWDIVLGPIISKNAIIHKFCNNVLYIKTTSSTWRAELLSRKNEIINLLNRKIGNEAIKKIIIK